jgi:uncharacterized protein with HEPN domain
MREYRLLLHDILQAAEDIHDFTSGMSKNDLAEDNKTRSAVLYKFAVMGEATKLLPDHIRAQYPDIPWRSIAGLRDKVIHGYIGVDYLAPVDDNRYKNPSCHCGQSWYPG